MRLGPEEAALRLKRHVVMSARRGLEDLAPGRKHVAVHLRVMDASGPQHLYNYPGPKYFQAELLTIMIVSNSAWKYFGPG